METARIRLCNRVGLRGQVYSSAFLAVPDGTEQDSHVLPSVESFRTLIFFSEAEKCIKMHCFSCFGEEV